MAQVAAVGELYDRRSCYPSETSSRGTVLDSAFQNCCAKRIRYFSIIQSMVYSISWGHKMAGLDACPSHQPLVKSTVEGARKILARPMQPKEPLLFSLVQKIAEHYSSKDSLASIRFLFVLLVGYAGFFA